MADVEKERQRALRLPVVTEAMVDNTLTKVNAMLKTTDRQKLKAALSHFIERIVIDGQDVTIEYTFKKLFTGKVPTTGDPGGI